MGNLNRCVMLPLGLVLGAYASIVAAQPVACMQVGKLDFSRPGLETKTCWETLPTSNNSASDLKESCTKRVASWDIKTQLVPVCPPPPVALGICFDVKGGSQASEAVLSNIYHYTPQSPKEWKKTAKKCEELGGKWVGLGSGSSLLGSLGLGSKPKLPSLPGGSSSSGNDQGSNMPNVPGSNVKPPNVSIKPGSGGKPTVKVEGETPDGKPINVNASGPSLKGKGPELSIKGETPDGKPLDVETVGPSADGKGPKVTVIGKTPDGKPIYAQSTGPSASGKAPTATVVGNTPDGKPVYATTQGPSASGKGPTATVIGTTPDGKPVYATTQGPSASGKGPTATVIGTTPDGKPLYATTQAPSADGDAPSATVVTQTADGKPVSVTSTGPSASGRAPSTTAIGGSRNGKPVTVEARGPGASAKPPSADPESTPLEVRPPGVEIKPGEDS